MTQAATTGPNPGQNAGLDDYNPFDKSQTKTTNEQPAVMNTTNADPPPTYSQSGAQQQQPQITTADFQVYILRILAYLLNWADISESVLVKVFCINLFKRCHFYIVRLKDY